MLYAFDLWSHEDVKDSAQDIFDRVSDGTMPCDAGWPDGQIDVLRRWIAAGCPA
jgi:hypothetical protein